MTEMRADIRPLIDELARQPGLPPGAAKDLEVAIASSPYLANVLASSIQNGDLKHLAILNHPNEAGRYDSKTGTISLAADNFDRQRWHDPQLRQDNITVVLGHEAGHALLADAERRERYMLSYEATEVVRQASHDGTSADVTAPVERYLAFTRRNEAMAELVGMNALASRTSGGQAADFNREEFLRRVDPSTPCVENGVLASGVRLSPDGIQRTGNKLVSPAVEAVAQCYTDRASRLGLHGDSGYAAYYGAYAMETLHEARRDYARGTTMHVPDIELDLAVLKLDPRKIERAGVDLGGAGQSFAYVDISHGHRNYEAISHTHSRVASGSRKDVAEAAQPAVPSQPRADHPSHPDFAAYDLIRQAVRSDGRWNEQQSDNIAAALLREHKADPLSKRLDEVSIGRPKAQGEVNVFAVYAPFGKQGPFFTAHVDAHIASQVPAEQSLTQVEQINQQRAQERAQAQSPESVQAQNGPRIAL
ncbi:hypothetical protein K4L06_03535 [Lysobacter sp. BMK333-48F3]|uniref:XVIPCD domain-containing protein n=1 Tax=Lysobacter sp. BMK333-48F3 TaxID=2867962 RepID=UPI001C8C4828|nr:XVIPCD domain-containing protein [Lysobacter sp. BMK333-48F3]MBX9400369.1 hypothetical protein [Lysobacter sp. BMK333-48F3]